jgi:putative flippase GtrA
MIRRSPFAQALRTAGPEGWRVVKFGMVGVLATLVHYGTAMALVSLRFTDLVAANVFGWLVALLVSWLGHRHFTFAKAEFKSASRLLFALVSLTAIAVSSAIAHLVELWNVPPSIGLLVAIAVIPAVTFIGHRFLVFRKTPA